jgi:hypothetical protein
MPEIALAPTLKGVERWWHFIDQFKPSKDAKTNTNKAAINASLIELQTPFIQLY